jgi:hypothetical protein
MSTHDSGRPPQPARRMVLRKIARSSSPPTRSQPVALPAPTAPPSRPPEASAVGVAGAGRRSSLPAPPVARGTLPPAPRAPATPNVLSSNRNRPSVPPVVASVVQQGLPTAPAKQMTSASPGKAGLVGGLLGLAIVALFVIGARLAYRSTPATTASTKPPATAAAAISVAPPSASVAHIPPPPPTALESPASAVRAQQAPRRDAVVRPKVPGAIAMATVKDPSQGVETAPQNSPAGASVTAAAAAAPPANRSAPAPADSANSLVPVLPSSAPPQVDPLVKAILGEDESRHK